MQTYSLDKYDFKKFLLAELENTRQEGLIFWKKTIPMPVDLVYEMFEKRGELFSQYLHHIGAACLLSYALEKEGQDWQTAIAAQPNEDNANRLHEWVPLFKKHLAASGVLVMLNNMASALMVTSFSANEQLLAEALCHDGRKYKRLYIPQSFKILIHSYYPKILKYIATTNGDMFSNVVADVLHIYRMGFADAFAGMFNKLIDFILDNTSGNAVALSSASAVKLVNLQQQPAVDDSIKYDVVDDGSLWEVYYKNSKNNYVINSSHPFYDLVKANVINTEQAFAMMMEGLAGIEGDTFRDTDLKIIRTHREELSRRLRLMAEEKRNSR